MSVCSKAGELENDGLVSGTSSMFGTYKGECIDDSISHIQIIDLFAKKENRQKIFEFYIRLCKELEETGY
jgi:triacylglycerol esterase/lipase EstA (alpha/beta hydrolase family)